MCDGNSEFILKFFKDFTLFVLHNGKIVNYATHGKVGNISEMIKKYNLKKIYFNIINHHDPFLNFMNYKCNPFYNDLHDKMEPVVGRLIKGDYSSLISYCPFAFNNNNNNNGHGDCSYCNGIRFLCIFYNPEESHKVITSFSKQFIICKPPSLSWKPRNQPYNRKNNNNNNYNMRPFCR